MIVVIFAVVVGPSSSDRRRPDGVVVLWRQQYEHNSNRQSRAQSAMAVQPLVAAGNIKHGKQRCATPVAKQYQPYKIHDVAKDEDEEE